MHFGTKNGRIFSLAQRILLGGKFTTCKYQSTSAWAERSTSAGTGIQVTYKYHFQKYALKYGY